MKSTFYKNGPRGWVSDMDPELQSWTTKLEKSFCYRGVTVGFNFVGVLFWVFVGVFVLVSVTQFLVRNTDPQRVVALLIHIVYRLEGQGLL